MYGGKKSALLYSQCVCVGGVVILKIRKDMLQRENDDMAILRVRKNVALLREKTHVYSEGT